MLSGRRFTPPALLSRALQPTGRHCRHQTAAFAAKRAIHHRLHFARPQQQHIAGGAELARPCHAAPGRPVLHPQQLHALGHIGHQQHAVETARGGPPASRSEAHGRYLVAVRVQHGGRFRCRRCGAAELGDDGQRRRPQMYLAAECADQHSQLGHAGGGIVRAVVVVVRQHDDRMQRGDFVVQLQIGEQGVGRAYRLLRVVGTEAGPNPGRG